MSDLDWSLIFDNALLRRLILKHRRLLNAPRCGTYGCSNLIPPNVIRFYMENTRGDGYNDFLERLEWDEICCDDCTRENLKECNHFGPLGTCARFQMIGQFQGCGPYSTHCDCGVVHDDDAENTWLYGTHACVMCRGDACFMYHENDFPEDPILLN